MKTSIDWNSIARKILSCIGGKSNVIEIFNCATRLRFKLKDNSLIKKDSLKSIKQVRGINRDGEEWHLIIGVGTVNKIMNALNVIMNVEKKTLSSKAIQPLWDRRINWYSNIFSITRRGIRGFASIFIPLIPLFIAGGLSLAINNFIGSLPDFDTNDTAKGFKSFFDHIGFAIFGSLPALVGFTAAKRWGGSKWLGMGVGLAISWGALTNSWAFYYEVTPPKWDVGEFSIEAIGYQAQVVPALLSIVFMVAIEKVMRKITHESVSIIFVPLVTVVLTTFFALWFIGPFGRIVGKGIADLFTLINQNANFTGFGLGGMLFGFAYPFIVITGLHQSFVPIELSLIANDGYTFITPYASISNVAQGTAAIVAAIYIRNRFLKNTGWSGGVSGHFGITEPAMFGVNLPLKYPMLAAAIGSAVGGYYAGITNLHSASFGSASWVGLVQFDVTSAKMQEFFAANSSGNLDPLLPSWAPISHAAIAMGLATISTIIVQILLRKTKWAKKQIAEFKMDLPKVSLKDFPRLFQKRIKNFQMGISETPISERVSNYFTTTVKGIERRLISPKLLEEEKTQPISTKSNIKKPFDRSSTKVFSPFNGKVIALKNVPDLVFSKKTLGDGIAILPTSNIVYSPIQGRITSLFPTGHAYTFTTSSNHAILLHIGLDTVKLKGEGFKSKAKKNMMVDKNSILGKIDLKRIGLKEKSLISPIILLDDPEMKKGIVKLHVKEGDIVTKGTLLFTIIDNN